MEKRCFIVIFVFLELNPFPLFDKGKGITDDKVNDTVFASKTVKDRIKVMMKVVQS